MLRYQTVRTRHGNDIAFAAFGAHGELEDAPVLFVHPLNLRKECWIDVASALAGQRRCVTIDLAGHGESSDTTDSGLDLWVSDCIDVVTSLQLDRFHVIGGSLGGTVALCLASALSDNVLSVTAMGSAIGDEPDVETDGGADPVELLDSGTVEEMFGVLAVAALAPGPPPELVATVRQLTNTHGAPMVRQILQAAQSANATSWLTGVRCPVLVITGEFDATCTPQAGAHMAASVNGRHEVLLDVGHLPMLEDGAAVIRLLAPHLDAAEAHEAVDTGVPSG